MKNKIIEKINKMSSSEILELYEYLFAKDTKINTSSKIIEKKFGAKEMQILNEICTGTKVDISMLEDFIKYRNEVKKPMKTIRPIKEYAQQLVMCSKAGYDLQEVVETMKNAEWQTVKLHWLKNTLSKKENGADLAQYGFSSNQTKRIES